MPAAARLAIGAAVGALLAELVGAAPTVAVGLAAALACRLAGHRGQVRDRGQDGGLRDPSAPRAERLGLLRDWLPAALGTMVVAGRVLLGAATAAPPPTLPQGSGPWPAIVESVGSPKAGTRPAVIELEPAPDGPTAGPSDASRTVRVAATLPWFPDVGPGDRIRVSGSLELPGDDAYGAYLRGIGAVASLRARTLDLDELSQGGWDELRRASAEALDRAIPSPEAGLAAGILVGLRDRVDRDLAAAFTTAGVSHIVAISGWNIAIVATTLGALTGRLGRRRRTIATAVAVVAYVAFVGPSPSVVRAAAMAGCALLARELGRPTTATAAMGLAVTGLLVLDPAYVDDSGFRLSVLATAGLIAWGSRWSRRLAGDRPGRARAWLAESLGVSLAAQAATLPVILLDFGRLSLVSPAVNLVVAPLVAPAMAAGGLALIAGLATLTVAPPALAMLLGLPAWVLLGAIVGIVRAAAALPLASLSIGPPANVVAAATAAVVVLAATRRGSWRRRRARRRDRLRDVTSPTRAEPGPAADVARGGAGRGPGGGRPAGSRAGPPGAAGRLVQRGAAALLVGALLAVGIAVVHRPDGTTRITVLDVGQGDSVLIEGGRGGRLLVDGGPDPGRLIIALDERLPPWDRRIDAVVLTHPHEDHVAGLALLLTRYRIGRVFEPGMIGPGPGYAAWNRELEAADAPTRWSLATGDELTVDDVRLRVLWPDPGAVPLHPGDGGTAINNVSIVLLGEVGGHRFLLAGDIEQQIDPVLLARGLPTVDLLKVAHHGSATSSTQPFLDAVRPKVAIVSVGAGNPYGHPAPTTIDRLRAATPRVYRTDLDGSVTVTLDGPAMRVRASGGRTARAAAEPVEAIVPARATVRLVSGFLCGVPRGTSARPASVDLPQARRLVTGPPASKLTVASARAATSPGTTPTGLPKLPRPPHLGRGGRAGLYHRPDDGPVPLGGDPPAPGPPAPTLAPAPLTRRGGGRRLARLAGHEASRRGDGRPKAGRDGRAPP